MHAHLSFVPRRSLALAIAACTVTLATALLAGCGAPAGAPLGSPPEAATAQLGRPTGEYPLPNGGRRLQYSQMPAGSQVWNLDYDAGGRLVSQDQALKYANFNLIVPDQWRQDDVLRAFGRPMLVEHVASFDGPVWSYRFNDLNNFRIISIHIDPAGVVRRVVFTDEIRSRRFGPF